MNTPTPDAVGQAVAQLQEALKQADGHESLSVMVKCADLRAVLDSRTGDAGEGKAYRCRGCGWRGPEPIANGHPQNGCDLELMVHDPIAATRAPAVDPVPAGRPGRIDAIDTAIRIGIFNTCIERGMDQDAATAIVKGTMAQLCVAAALAKGKAQ